MLVSKNGRKDGRKEGRIEEWMEGRKGKKREYVGM